MKILNSIKITFSIWRVFDPFFVSVPATSVNTITSVYVKILSIFGFTISWLSNKP